MLAKKGRVSVWLGNVRDRASWDAYSEEHYDNVDDDGPTSAFPADLDELFCDHDFMETEWREAPTPIAELLSGCSYVDTFRDAVLAASAKRHVRRANAMDGAAISPFS